MSVKSKAQRRLMFAALEGKVKGLSKEVAKEFLDETPKGKKLPEKFPNIKKLIKRK